MEMRGLMGGFYRISEWIMRLSAINLLWIFCSLPFVFLLIAQLLFLSSQAEPVIDNVYKLIGFMLPPLITMPFTLFPASAAMFSVARKWIMGDEDIPLFRSYFRYFKANYKASMIGGLFFVVMLIVLLVNLQFYADTNSWLSSFRLLFLVFIVILLASAINFLSFVSHFEMTTWMLIKNSIFFTIGRPLTTIYLLASNFAILYISTVQFQFLIPFFMGSLMAIVSFWGFYRVINKLREKEEERMKQQEEEQNGA